MFSRLTRLLLLLCLAIPYGFAAGADMSDLQKAIRASDLEAVRQLTRNMPAANINNEIKYGKTPLHEAVSRYSGLAGRLVKPFHPERIVDPDNRRRQIQQRAEMESRKESAFAIVQHLLEAGANPNARDNVGNTPMLGMNQYHAVYEDMIRLLQDHGADINARGRGDNTVLHEVARRSDNELDITILFRLGADPGIANDDGMTPLMVAARSKNSRVIRAFIDNGADVRATDKRGRTALHFAAHYNNWRAMNLLLDAGSDLEAEDERGRTPISYAANHKQWSMVRRLLEKGANANVTVSGQQQSVADIIMTKPALGLAGLLNENTFIPNRAFKSRHSRIEKYPELFGPAANLNVEAVEKYLALGSDPNANAGAFRIPLIEVVKQRWSSDPAWLVRIGNGRTQDPRLNTYLREHREKADKARRIFDLLMEHGANPDIIDYEGNTPLMEAAGIANIEAIRALIEHGADANKRNEDDTTALIAAVSDGHWNTAALLVNNGADVLAAGQSPRSSHIDVWPLGTVLNAYIGTLRGKPTEREEMLQYAEEQKQPQEEKTLPYDVTPDIRESMIAQFETGWLRAREHYNRIRTAVSDWFANLMQQLHPAKDEPAQTADIDYDTDDFQALLLKMLRSLPDDTRLDLDEQTYSNVYELIFTEPGVAPEIRRLAKGINVTFKESGGIWRSYLRTRMEAISKKNNISAPDKLRAELKKIFPEQAVDEVKTIDELRADYRRRSLAGSPPPRTDKSSEPITTIPPFVLKALAELPAEYREEYLRKHDLSEMDLQRAKQSGGTESTPELPDECRLEDLPDGTQLAVHYVRSGEYLARTRLAENSHTYEVGVEVDATENPLVLTVIGDAPIVWRFGIHDPHRLKGVVVGGRYNQKIEGLDENVPIIRAVRPDKNDCGELEFDEAVSYLYRVTGISEPDLKVYKKLAVLHAGETPDKADNKPAARNNLAGITRSKLTGDRLLAFAGGSGNNAAELIGLVDKLYRQLNIPAGQRLDFGKIEKKINYQTIKDAEKTNFCRNAIIVHSDDVTVGAMATNCIIIGGGDVEIVHADRTLTIAGGDVDYAFDGQLDDSGPSLILAKGKVEIGHAKNTYIYAGRGVINSHHHSLHILNPEHAYARNGGYKFITVPEVF